MEWYCIVTGSQRGPMSLDELRALVRDGTLKPEDYVWNESFGEQWRRMRDVPELALPPPLASAAAPAPELDAGFVPVSSTPLTGVPGSRPFFALAMQQAWDRMKDILFRNASFARWMGMAFCVWISIIGMNEPNLAGEALIGRAQPDPALLRSKIEACTTPDQMMNIYVDVLNQTTERARELLTPKLIGTALAIWLVLLAITCWLRARGAFMVMHRWHHPDATIAQSWAVGSGLGRSLFLFRLGFGLIMGVLTVVIGIDFHVHVFAPLLGGAAFTGALATRGCLLVMGISLVLTVWITVAILVTHFVVPIMYWRRVGLLAAWRAVMEFCNERPGAMTIYFTMYIILVHVALAALALGMCCTCCCVSYLLILPFLNGILLLPATIFFRGLGISFLRQWRPDLETACR